METSIQLTPMRSFVMVAQLGSFAEVARVLGYTEPAVHLQIAGLKKLAGGELFYRSGRRMHLTPLGERLLPHAVEALGAIQRLSTEIANWRATEGHVLRLGLGRSSGTYLFPYVAALLSRSHPHILVQPSIMPLDEIVDSLSKGTIDIAIITSLRVRTHGRKEQPRLVAAPLAPYYWSLLGRADMTGEAARERGIRLTDIFLPEYAAGMAASIEERIRGRVGCVAIHISPNAEAAKANALAGRGLAYLPEHVCRLEVSTGELVHLLPEEERQRSTVDIGHVHPANHRDIGPVVQSLRGLRSQLL